jgi:hypothetical protein
MRPAHLLCAVVAGIGLAVPASAKEGVRAKLDAPVRLDTAPGKTIRVAWHLADVKGRPFGAGGIYLRVSRCGRKPLAVAATARGHGGFSARVRVPKGGIRRLVVGLQGWRITPNSKRRADVFFPFDPPLARRCR